MKYSKLFMLLFFLMGSISFSQEVIKNFDEILYKAITRGNSVVLKITSENVFYKDRKQERNEKITNANREKLIDLINEIVLSKMGQYKVLSNESASDRAMQAELIIKVNGEEYKSSIFDDGNPPEELKEIIETMMRLGKPE
ncbi:hypothetical protein SAMN04489761_2518 [Tenacibaculum sp. MAR_2009_124]|uniref:hypothetical protein n=1 Tax=Tenacibaculum sp. MAR_2009_124 TaxID=1250059 RepID=UPI0008964C8D|nr:hypothetical protein [Tenacibaculum sp. MAR_2009_124]SEC26263.1 hypothetical protein SAMN04489761_2518 [Tenacibaculum sp. MAR_2009_124]